jgi:hypothetical protein
MTAGTIVRCALLILLSAAPAAAQDDAPQPSPPPPSNPWAERPVCASMFMKADWQLTAKQRLCDFTHNGVFSTNAMLGAAWSAGYSMWTDNTSEAGDGFATRFGRRFGQNAFKSAGGYVGTLIAGEDPRRRPPYLAMRTVRPRGFWKRLGYAVGGNFVSYRCVDDCDDESDIRLRPALSRVLGSLASGAAGELMTTDRPRSYSHGLRGAASAFGSTFVSAGLTEFNPEISAFAGRTFTAIFGAR